jgi:hypothetical protein
LIQALGPDIRPILSHVNRSTVKEVECKINKFGNCAGTMDGIATRKQKLETRQQILHALAASCVQSRQFFAITLREQLFELKNENAI